MANPVERYKDLRDNLDSSGKGRENYKARKTRQKNEKNWAEEQETRAAIARQKEGKRIAGKLGKRAGISDIIIRAYTK